MARLGPPEKKKKKKKKKKKRKKERRRRRREEDNENHFSFCGYFLFFWDRRKLFMRRTPTNWVKRLEISHTRYSTKNRQFLVR